MSKADCRLRLGPLPKIDMVKLTVVVTSELQANLERYAALHAQSYGEAIDVAILVSHMLQAVMARDRGFQVLRRKVAGEPKKSDVSANSRDRLQAELKAWLLVWRGLRAG